MAKGTDNTLATKARIATTIMALGMVARVADNLTAAVAAIVTTCARPIAETPTDLLPIRPLANRCLPR